jgi:hypothetical protein
VYWDEDFVAESRAVIKEVSALRSGWELCGFCLGKDWRAFRTIDGGSDAHFSNKFVGKLREAENAVSGVWVEQFALW